MQKKVSQQQKCSTNFGRELGQEPLWRKEKAKHDWCQREGFWLAGAILSSDVTSADEQILPPTSFRKRTALLLLDTIVFPSFIGVKGHGRENRRRT
jgi:hypothetical protein